MRALFDQVAVVHDHDPVGAAEDGEAVGNDEHRTVSGDHVQVLPDHGLAFRVECAGGFVENEEARVRKERTRNSEALALTAGQVGGVFLEERVVAAAHLLDEFVGAGETRGVDDLLHGGVLLREGQVLADGAVEEVVVLQHDTDGGTQRRAVDLADVDAVILDDAGLERIEALDELGERGLAGTGTADEADGGTGRDVEVEVLDDHRGVRRIPEIHVLDGELALELVVEGAADLLLRAVHDDAEHTDGEEGLLVFVDEADDVDQRAGDASGEHLEGDELADGERAVEDRERADPDDGDEHEFFDEAGERLGGDGDLRHAEIARDRERRRVVPLALLRGLEREGLHGADAVDGLD